MSEHDHFWVPKLEKIRNPIVFENLGQEKIWFIHIWHPFQWIMIVLLSFYQLKSVKIILVCMQFNEELRRVLIFSVRW